MGLRVNRSEHIQRFEKKNFGKRGSKKEKRNYSSTKRRETKKDAIKNVWEKKKKKSFRQIFEGRTNSTRVESMYEAFHYFSFFPPEIERGRIHKSDLNH